MPNESFFPEMMSALPRADVPPVLPLKCCEKPAFFVESAKMRGKGHEAKWAKRILR
jgi:hypothetical protein